MALLVYPKSRHFKEDMVPSDLTLMEQYTIQVLQHSTIQVSTKNCGGVAKKTVTIIENMINLV